MAYELITKYDSRNYTPAARCLATFGHARIVKSITVHWWGTPGQTSDFDGTCRYLLDNANLTSSNYVIEAGKVACIVDPDDASHANGHAAGNATSITIEANPRASRADKETLAELIADLRAVYGDVPVYGHNHWTATQCPGHYDVQEISRMAFSVAAERKRPTVKPAEASKPKPIVKPKPKPKPKPKTGRLWRRPKSGLYWTVRRGDTLREIADHYGMNVDRLAKKNRIRNKNRIEVGQFIRIPGPLYWIVEPGDSVAKIAEHYGITVEVLARNARLRNVNLIYPGQKLRVI